MAFSPRSTTPSTAAAASFLPLHPRIATPFSSPSSSPLLLPRPPHLIRNRWLAAVGGVAVGRLIESIGKAAIVTTSPSAASFLPLHPRIAPLSSSPSLHTPPPPRPPPSCYLDLLVCFATGNLLAREASGSGNSSKASATPWGVDLFFGKHDL